MKNLDVVLSGGGTRAALLSAGACLALEELHDKRKIAVKKVHSISGSSLWLAALFSSKEDEDVRCKAEAGRIVRYGFARSFSYWPKHLVILFVCILFQFVLELGNVLEVGGEGLLEGKRDFYFLVTLFMYVALYLFLLRMGVSIGLGRTWLTRNSKYRKIEPTIPAFLGDTDLTFGATKIDDFAHTPLKIEAGKEIDLDAHAKASAAFPGAIGSVEINKVHYLDGGATGNLGLTPLLDLEPEGSASPDLSPRDSELFIVDAELPAEKVHLRKAYSPEQTISYLLLLSAVAVVVGYFISSIKMNLTLREVLTFLDLSVLVGFGTYLLVSRDQYNAIKNSFTLESKAVPAMLNHSRKQTFKLLKLEKISDQHVSLENSEMANETKKLSKWAEIRNRPAAKVNPMPTQLSPLHRSVAKKLIEYGYCQTHEKLASEPNSETLSWIRELPNPWWARTLIMRLNKWLIGIFVFVSLLLSVGYGKDLISLVSSYVG